MQSDMRWRIFVKDLETRVKIGIHQHEREAQRLLVNAEIEGIYSAMPKGIEDCFNYDHIHNLVIGQWPSRPHVELLETLVIDLLKHIYTMDQRVDYAKVSISKPDIFKEAQGAGVEAGWTIEDYRHYTQLKE